MPSRPRLGVLPLFLALYDRSLPHLRGAQASFLDLVVRRLGEAGLDVVAAPICCVRSEVDAALDRLSREGVDLLATLHLAYSPSLEAAAPLAASPLPLVLLDTTPDCSFGRDVDPGQLLYDHAIHGVQDLASVLRRLSKPYRVIAGHVSDGRILERTAELARAARAARALRGLRVLRIGRPFEGMGDFQVDERVLLDRFGIEVDEFGSADLALDAAAVSDSDIEREMALDRESFEVVAPREAHVRTTRVCLGLRRRLERGRYGALSMSFLAFDQAKGPVSTVPFLECSKAMARGLGYAGEGDVLTAALVGALQSGFGGTTFTEIFCPDWKGGTVFISHMGEFNPEIAAAKPRLYEKPFPFTPTRDPACIACAPRAGPATLVNLAPGPGESFRLIIAPVEILPDGTHPDYLEWVRGWLDPRMPLERFLEEYSRLGGTHHSALVLGDHAEALEAFAEIAGIEPCRVRG